MSRIAAEILVGPLGLLLNAATDHTTFSNFLESINTTTSDSTDYKTLWKNLANYNTTIKPDKPAPGPFARSFDIDHITKAQYYLKILEMIRVTLNHEFETLTKRPEELEQQYRQQETELIPKLKSLLKRAQDLMPQSPSSKPTPQPVSEKSFIDILRALCDASRYLNEIQIDTLPLHQKNSLTTLIIDIRSFLDDHDKKITQKINALKPKNIPPQINAAENSCKLLCIMAGYQKTTSPQDALLVCSQILEYFNKTSILITTFCKLLTDIACDYLTFAMKQSSVPHRSLVPKHMHTLTFETACQKSVTYNAVTNQTLCLNRIYQHFLQLAGIIPIPDASSEATHHTRPEPDYSGVLSQTLFKPEEQEEPLEPPPSPGIKTTTPPKTLRMATAVPI